MKVCWTRKMRSSVWLLAIVLLFIKTNYGAITIKDKGYSGIVVAIKQTLTEQQGIPLIDTIKELFTDASGVLYEATHGRAYFKNVTILVPKIWNNNGYEEATSETYRSSDIRIEEPNSKYGNAPYTLQNRGCGYPGLYIQLTPDYLKNLAGNSTKNFGDPAKTLVHEWAHFRYGVFDEFGLPGDKKFPLFYFDNDVLKPNYCANEVVLGNFRNFKRQDGSCSYGQDGLPDKDCVFVPDRFNSNATTNLNSYHYLTHVKHFCNDSNHNKLAPNKHNRLCRGRSSWDVIVKNEDFKITSSVDIKNFKPNFKIVQEAAPVFVLVLDLSGSMDTAAPVKPSTRLTVLGETVRRWIKDEVVDGWSVGIVTFSDGAEIAHEIIKIQNPNDRQKLLSKVPIKTTGGTCIGCGLNKAIEELRKFKKGPGGTIILISDGEETIAPKVKDVMPSLLISKARVIAIAISQKSSVTMELVARDTGGKTYFASDKNALEAMGSAFYDVVTQQESDEETIIKLSENVINNPTGTFIKGSFIVDASVGGKTSINFIYKIENDITEITLMKRDGTNLAKWPQNTSVTHQDQILKQIRIQFSYLQPGFYNYTIKRKSAKNQGISVIVLSRSNSTKIQPIVTRCWMAKEQRSNHVRYIIYAEVKKGNFPIIKAAVKAKIDRPDDSFIMEDLFDDGKGPDIEADDGIYSRYFTKFSGQGRYTVKATVLGNDNSSIRETGFTASRSPPIFNEETMKIQETKDVQTGDFERTTDGGSINIPNPPTTSQDIYPPIEVDDLREDISKRDCRILNNENLCKFTLQWTAPGDDLDDGQAAKYDLRYSDNQAAFFNDFNTGTIIPINKTPLPSRQTETVTIEIKNFPFDKNIFLALKTADEVPQWSDVSNYLTIRVVSPPTTTTITSTTTTPTTTTRPPTTTTPIITTTTKPPITTTPVITTTSQSTSTSEITITDSVPITNATVTTSETNTTFTPNTNATAISATSSKEPSTTNSLPGAKAKQGSGTVTLTVGLVVGGLVVVTIAAGAVWFFCKKKV